MVAVGVDVVRVTGRMVFELTRDEDKTTRNIEIPYPINDSDSLQAAVNLANTTFTNSANQMNVFIQPSNWRDDNDSEKQWTTTRVYYESIQTITRPIEPDENP